MAKSKMNLEDLCKLLRATPQVEFYKSPSTWRAFFTSWDDDAMHFYLIQGDESNCETNEALKICASSPNETMIALCNRIQGKKVLKSGFGLGPVETVITIPDIIEHGLKE